jgi:hypothetical protein
MSCGGIHDSVKIIASEILTLLETVISVVLFPLIEAIFAREEATQRRNKRKQISLVKKILVRQCTLYRNLATYIQE